MPASRSKGEIIAIKEITNSDLSELTQQTDQQIKEFLEEKEKNEERQKIVFEIIQKLKINQSITDIEDELSNDENEKIQLDMMRLFETFIKPDNIEIVDKSAHIEYDFSEGSKLREKINEIARWDADNVIETVSRMLNISIDNIEFIDNVSRYIEFINNLGENNYLSRGQKDCKYELKASLHRLYENGFESHLSDYESMFKQKILYYDIATDKMSCEELRAYGQHYGLPTNYLDFTEAHLISLLFAVEDFEYVENHSIVYFVDAVSYNENTIKAEKKSVDFSDSAIKDSVEKSYSDRSYFISVGNCNERIHFQRGCFLRVKDEGDLKRMLENYTKVVIIDKNSKKNILKELFKLGITFENIYPDKDNMVRTIKFMREHM